jgi:putative membrane protein
MKNKRALMFSMTILLSVFGFTACQRDEGVEAAREPASTADRQSVLSEDEKDFAEYASEMHAGEIEMAKQAKQKSTNEDVRDYADAVINTHSDALKDLSRDVGNESRKASLDTQSHVKYLAPLSGAQFDKEFVALMIADHQSATDTFREGVNFTHNKELKDYLQNTLSDLEKGLKDGQQLQSKLTGQGTTN